MVSSHCRRAILRSYKDFYGKIVLDVGAGTGRGKNMTRNSFNLPLRCISSINLFVFVFYSGILSMFCVHAGAKKGNNHEHEISAELIKLFHQDCLSNLSMVVYSVEASDMAPQISKLVQANGMSDKITIIHGKVEVYLNILSLARSF